MLQFRLITVLLFFCQSARPILPIDIKNDFVIDSTYYHIQDMLAEANKLYGQNYYSEALVKYKLLLDDKDIDKAYVLKKMALSHAALNNATESTQYTKAYFLREFDASFLMNDGFDRIKNSRQFQEIAGKYLPKLTMWSFIYLYCALIGFYIAVIINFNKKIESKARILISSFVFIHSFFILHVFVSITNYEYNYPHSYRMSTAFSFLYGPLLYFYFKRITRRYSFKKVDLLHLIPTIIFLIYFLPVYFLTGTRKLALMMEESTQGITTTNLIIGTSKLISLMLYGYFIRKLYLKGKRKEDCSRSNKIWQRNIYIIHFLYIISYAFYCVLISNNMSLFHSQVICMALMVLYVGYSANVQPDVFNGAYSDDNQLFFKYKNSGLTKNLSKELKERLVSLFNNEKIYKESDISLELLAEKLNTTRHNASQVINEHFNLNFHELINKYRIQEAKDILESDYL